VADEGCGRLLDAEDPADRLADVPDLLTDGEQARIDVRDSGPGIPQDAQGRIFEAFHRAPETRSQAEGLGLGLAVVQGLAGQLGHEIALRSKPGRGSIFRVIAQRIQPAELPAPATTPLDGLRIAVLDLHANDCSALEERLEGWGCVSSERSDADVWLIGCEKGSEGLQRLREAILQLAVCGRLVPQDPAEEPASTLIECMAKEKELLVEKKQIRNPKPLPPIKEEEIASHVPESCLVRRLGEASIAITKGTTPTTLGFAYQSSGVNFVKVENIVNGRIDRGGLSEFIVEDAHEALARPQLQLGDVLFSIAGTIGKTCIVRDEDLPANTNQALAIVRGTAIVFDSEYLQNVLDSAVAKWMHEKARGGAMKNVSLGDLTHLPIPIPPWLNNSGSSRRSPS